MKDDYDYDLIRRPTARQKRWYAVQKWWRSKLREIGLLAAVEVSCPRCGGDRIREISYGMRRPHADPEQEAAFHEKYYDAGCVVTQAKHHCDNCRLDFPEIEAKERTTY